MGILPISSRRGRTTNNNRRSIATHCDDRHIATGIAMLHRHACSEVSTVHLCCLLFVVCCVLFVACCLLHVVCCVLFVACRHHCVLLPRSLLSAPCHPPLLLSAPSLCLLVRLADWCVALPDFVPAAIIVVTLAIFVLSTVAIRHSS